MRKIAGFVIAIAGLVLAETANAADPYIGLSRTTPGETYADFSGVRGVENYNSPFAMKLYGGIDLTDHLGLELGYGLFGTWKIADPTPGGSDEFRTTSRLTYLAGTATTPLGQSFSVFGKVGLAANTIEQERGAALPASSTSALRAMLGLGTGYQITKHLAGVLEFNYYGAVSDNFTQQKLELGVKYSF